MVQEEEHWAEHSPNNIHNLLLLLIWSLTCSMMEEHRTSFCHMANMTTIGWARCWNQNVPNNVSWTIYSIYIYFYQDIKINEKYIILKTFQQEQSDDLFLMYCRGGDPVCSSAIWSSLQLWHQMYFSINIKQFQGKARTIKRRCLGSYRCQCLKRNVSCQLSTTSSYTSYIVHSVVNYSFVCLFSFITNLFSVCNVCTKITCTALSRTRFNPFKCWLSHSMKLML